MKIYLKSFHSAHFSYSNNTLYIPTNVTLTLYPLLVLRSKIEKSYTSTLPKGLRGLWKRETYLYPNKMHLKNKIHVLLTALSYMVRRLLLHHQGEIIIFSKLLLHCLITLIKLYYIWVYNFIYSYLKSHILFKIKLKTV